MARTPNLPLDISSPLPQATRIPPKRDRRGALSASLRSVLLVGNYFVVLPLLIRVVSQVSPHRPAGPTGVHCVSSLRRRRILARKASAALSLPRNCLNPVRNLLSRIGTLSKDSSPWKSPLLPQPADLRRQEDPPVLPNGRKQRNIACSGDLPQGVRSDMPELPFSIGLFLYNRGFRLQHFSRSLSSRRFCERSWYTFRSLRLTARPCRLMEPSRCSRMHARAFGAQEKSAPSLTIGCALRISARMALRWHP